MTTLDPDVRDALVVALPALVIVRRLWARPIRSRAPIVLAIVALGHCALVVVTGIRSAGADAATIVLLGVSLALAATSGGVRAHTTTARREPNGWAWRRGGLMTVWAWLVGFAVQLRRLCVGLIAQNWLIRADARRLSTAARPA